MKILPLKGMNDYLPAEVALRDYLQNTILAVYRSAGYERISTPALEDIENIDKSEGGDNLNLIFRVLKRGEKGDAAFESGDMKSLCDMGLRYDLTLPLSRYYANNRAKLLTPMKCIQTDRVYRAERPQKGRLREFVQCDIDILGSSSPDCEVDLIVTTAKALKAVGLKAFTVKINDRALLLSLLSALGVPAEMTDSVCITLDKLDKIGLDGVVGELTEKGVSEDCIGRLSDLFSEDVTLARVCGLAGNEEAAARLTYIMDTVRALVGDAFGLEYDVTLIRGQGYYTGTVFEVRSDEFRGSIAGGGRYDRLIGKFIGEDVPAVGFSIGFERIFSILRDAGVSVPDRRERIAFLYRHEEYLAAMKAAEDLRKEADVSMVEKTGKVGKLLARLEAYGFDGCAEFDEEGNLRRRAFGSK